MRNMDFTHFLNSSNAEITSPIRIFLSGHGMNFEEMKKLISRLQTCPQPVALYFSHSGITENSAILLAQALPTLRQPVIIYFKKSGVENSIQCQGAFSAVIASSHYPVGTLIYDLNPKITFWCETSILIVLTKMLFALSPYKTDVNDKTKKFTGFPRDIAQVILGFITTAQLDRAFVVREKINKERENERNSCALS